MTLHFLLKGVRFSLKTKQLEFNFMQQNIWINIRPFLSKHFSRPAYSDIILNIAAIILGIINMNYDMMIENMEINRFLSWFN